jgi:capsular polysaccharide transport system ATP-binding protein
MTAMFELHDVWKEGGRKIGQLSGWTLAGATVAFPPGRRIALFGADATQNTVVLRIISGVMTPDKGAVRRVGVPCWPFEFGAFTEARASLAQNATFLSQVYNVDPGEVTRIATRLSGVRVTKGKPLAHYLSHERKALQLGLTLAFQFDWYFVDEKLPKPPQETAAMVEAALLDRLGRGSVVWATTDPERVHGFCDAGLVLDQGQLTFYNDFDEAAEAYRLSAESKVRKGNDRKSRDPSRRRGSARRQSTLDPEKSG